MISRGSKQAPQYWLDSETDLRYESIDNEYELDAAKRARWITDDWNRRHDLKQFVLEASIRLMDEYLEIEDSWR